MIVIFMVSFTCQRLQMTKTLPKFDMLPQQSDQAKETRPQASLLLYINGLIWILLTLRHNHPEQPTFYLFGHKLLRSLECRVAPNARHTKRAQKGRKTWRKISQRPFTTPHYGGALGRGSSCGTGTPAGYAEDLRRKFITSFT